MSTYASKPAAVSRSAEDIFARFSDMTRLQEQLDRLPADQRAKVGEVEFTPDSMKISTPQVGDIKFVILRREAPATADGTLGKVVFGTESSPVPLTMEVDITPVDVASCSVTTQIDVELPVFARAIVGPQLQKAADRFGELISGLAM